MRRTRHRTHRQPPLRVGLFGILGSGNLGNDASLDVVMRSLRERHPDADLGFFAMGPDHLERRYGAPAVHLQWYEANMERLARLPAPLLKVVGRLLDPVRTLAWVRHQDVVLVPGAGVLETTTPMRPWAFPYSLLSLGLAARLVGTRVGLVCVGANVVAKGPTRWILSRATRLVDYRSYRDELSRDAMREMGVDVHADKVYPDLAFALEVPERGPVGPRTVGFGLMNYRGGAQDRARADEMHEAYVDAVTRLVRLLVDDGWQVRLFPGDREDETVVRRVLGAVQLRSAGDGAAPVVAERVGTMADLMRVMAGVDVVVATRYHNVLAALKMSIPTLSIGYAAKLDVLMATMGLGEFCQSAASIDVDRAIEQLRELEARNDELTELLRQRNRAQTEGVRRQLDALSRFLRPGTAEAVDRRSAAGEPTSQA
ncbi:polysaccharide pyruvyl transferase family protein [Nocardioides koreensis]|uniref:Polysaccharide pyruvyl transferase family protein n=1 Tax=Nocardioides koreensis TaxID=433651 RepID=A0ABP5L7K9_9ACTN